MDAATFGTSEMRSTTRQRPRRNNTSRNNTSRKPKKSKRRKNGKKYIKKVNKNINQSGGNIIDGISKSVLNPAIKAVGSAIGSGLESIFSILT